MRFRKLRIAWSVGWGVVAVLLLCLWVRSHIVADVVQWSATKWTGFQFTSQWGQLTGRRCDLDGAGHHGGMDFPEWRWSRSRPGSFSNSPTTLGFNLGHLSFYIGLPYWALVVFSAALAAVAWTPRVPRFSLRTLLIATTLAGVILGFVVWLSQ